MTTKQQITLDRIADVLWYLKGSIDGSNGCGHFGESHVGALRDAMDALRRLYEADGKESGK